MRKAQKDKIIYTVLLVLCIVIFWAIEQYFWSPEFKIREEGEVEIPEYVYPETQKAKIVKHNHYALVYNEEHEQAQWVVYGLFRSHLTTDNRERPYFIEDPKVKSGSADWRNYKNSGYDRGHLCPAGDRRFSESAYNETFYTSNISPMNREFNAGIWNRLEIQVRNWARKYDSLWVVTGGMLTDDLPDIGYESVSVPEAFYKIVIRGSEDRLEAIAFLIPHRESTLPLNEFRIAIDSIEELSGIDFFEALDDELESKLESRVNGSVWRY